MSKEPSEGGAQVNADHVAQAKQGWVWFLLAAGLRAIRDLEAERAALRGMLHECREALEQAEDCCDDVAAPTLAQALDDLYVLDSTGFSESEAISRARAVVEAADRERGVRVEGEAIADRAATAPNKRDIGAASANEPRSLVGQPTPPAGELDPMTEFVEDMGAPAVGVAAGARAFLAGSTT